MTSSSCRTRGAPESPEVVRLGSDAQPVAVSTGPLVQFDPWQIQFLETTGQMIVNDTGGVYLVDDIGAATRISTGDLVFLGPNHFVLRECDGVRVCMYVRVDQATGQARQCRPGCTRPVPAVGRSVDVVAVARRHGGQLLRLAERWSPGWPAGWSTSRRAPMCR